MKKPKTNPPFIHNYSTVKSAEDKRSEDWIMVIFWHLQQHLPLQSGLLSALGPPVSAEGWGHSLGCPALMDSSQYPPCRAPGSWEEAGPCGKSHRRQQRHRGAVLSNVTLREDWTGSLHQYLQKWRKKIEMKHLSNSYTHQLRFCLSLTILHAWPGQILKLFSTLKY